MNDSKSNYSSSSSKYKNEEIQKNQIDYQRAERSKIRKEKYEENWDKNPVNLNDIVAKFCPNAVEKTESGIKYVYQNSDYKIECDKVAGYLRIYDKKLKKYVKLNGEPGTDEETHFRIKKRSEM